MLQALPRQVRGKGHRQQGDQNGLKVEKTSPNVFSSLKMMKRCLKISSDLPVEKKTAKQSGDNARVVCRAGGE